MSESKKYLTPEEIASIVSSVPTESEEEEEDDDDESFSSNSSTLTDSEFSDLENASGDEYIPAEPRKSTSYWSSNITEAITHSFSESPGVKTSVSIDCELDAFNVYFDDELIDFVVKETNFCMNRNISSGDEPSSSKGKLLDSSEMRVFLALTLLAGIVKKPEIKLYFSTHPLLATPFFNKAMTRDRYMWILKFLYFTANPDAKNISKVSAVLDNLQAKFKSVYKPEQNIAISENFIDWKGKFNIGHFALVTKSRLGVKIYKLTESQSQYVWNFSIGSGKNSENIVKSLLDNLTGKGYNLYLDQPLMSPSLVQTLYKNDTNVCGFVFKTRRGMPTTFPSTDMCSLDVAAVQKGNMKLIAFKPYREVQEVLVLTTFHENKNVETARIDKTTGSPIQRPECVLDLKKNMKAVDISDIFTVLYPCFRRTVKWYKKLFFYFLEVSVLNANVIFNRSMGESSSAFVFKVKLIEQLVSTYLTSKPNVMQGAVMKSREPACNPLRLSGRHFPTFCGVDKKPKSVRRRCYICSHLKRREKGSRTCYECKTCNVGLCVDPCFAIYHTQKKL